MPHPDGIGQSFRSKVDVGHCFYTKVPYDEPMTTQPQINPLRNAKLLIAAVQLRKTHGLLYAMRFLEEHHFNTVVIWEVLNLIPAEGVADATDCSKNSI